MLKYSIIGRLLIAFKFLYKSSQISYDFQQNQSEVWAKPSVDKKIPF